MDLITMYMERQKAKGEQNMREAQQGDPRQTDGPIVRDWRRSLWITQRQMATDLGISVKRLSDFEKGEDIDRLKELKLACEWYLSFCQVQLRRERFTTERWQRFRQDQLRQLEWRRANNII